jgi:hypothetical protein
MGVTDLHKVNLFVEPELWRLVKIRAAEREVTAILNEALRLYFEAPAARTPHRRPKGA